MNDNIIPINPDEAYKENMARYSLYVLFNRYVPDIRDGFTPVQRRIIYTMWHDVGCTSLAKKRKSANTTGNVIASYHPHGESGVYGAMKSMTNWWEIKVPLLKYDSNSGSLQGGPQAAARYTESYLSEFTMECVVGELKETSKIVDWQETFDRHNMEPQYLPVKVPLLLVNGTFGIAIGTRIEIPSHSLNDVIDATISVLHNPRAKVVLIPDPCMKCEIVDTNFKEISNKGYGYYICRGIINHIHNNKTGLDELSIQSVPDLILPDNVVAKIEELIKNNILIQILEINDHSTNEQLDIRLVLKPGSDVNYVKQVLYKNTSLQTTQRVNAQVILGDNITNISYKAYIVSFLEERRTQKFRLYNDRLQTANTRLHQIEVYIKILESGDVETIIHKIRNQNPKTEDTLILWLMKTLSITDLQAKFILQTPIGRLSKSHLKKYKEEQAALISDISNFTQMITNEALIDAEIEQELLYIRNKYGCPRKSVIISESEASGIPEGEFRIIITEQNFVKKQLVNDPIKIIKGDNPRYILTCDNAKDILLFDQMGKVFKLQVSKIQFTDKNSPGIDIRLLCKNLTSGIAAVFYVPLIEAIMDKMTKYFLIILTRNGLIKKIDMDDVINATMSGIIYSRLNTGDSVCDITIASLDSDIVIYNKSKALRVSVDSIPYLKRNTLGNISMKTDDPIEGMSAITQDTSDLIVITNNGMCNRLNPEALQRNKCNKPGNKVISLKRGDYIKAIFSVYKNSNPKIRIIRADETLEISASDIPIGSSVSGGVKICKNNILKVELLP